MNFEWFWIIVILLNASATITLWQRAARRPAKLKKKFRKLVWQSEPITPKHERPPPVREDTYGVGKGWAQFFSDFKDFANVVNWWLAHPDLNPNNPWRLQELPKSELSALAMFSPAYGRRYAIFHNQARVGEIEIKPDPYYSAEKPQVSAHVEVEWARLFGSSKIRDFLTEIAYYISEPRERLAYLETNRIIDLALMDVLWETQEISQFGMDNEPGYGSIEVQFSGLATYYLDRRQGFRREKVEQHTERTKQAPR